MRRHRICHSRLGLRTAHPAGPRRSTPMQAAHQCCTRSPGRACLCANARSPQPRRWCAWCTATSHCVAHRPLRTCRRIQRSKSSRQAQRRTERKHSAHACACPYAQPVPAPCRNTEASGAPAAGKALQPGADRRGLELPLVALSRALVAVAQRQQRGRRVHAEALGQLRIGRLHLPERLPRARGVCMAPRASALLTRPCSPVRGCRPHRAGPSPCAVGRRCTVGHSPLCANLAHNITAAS